MILSDVQKEIVNTSGNMVIRASAGTGKTHTMVSKISKEIEENHTHKVIAAITFTRKAAKEIRDRLKFDISRHFIGTNNSFVIEEIIKPFARVAYPQIEFSKGMNTDYSIKRKDFYECLKELESGIICTYKDSKKNFVFELALEIVKTSKACKLFLQAKYFKIYVDEYQDCDEAMHNFFMYLCKELGIELFIVGDEKQSIYTWRGAYPDAFISVLKMETFTEKELRKNHRSCQAIQNYSNLLFDDTKELYKADEASSSIIYIRTNSSDWYKNIEEYLDFTKTIALLRFSNKNAELGANELSRTGTKFTYVPTTPISEITTDTAWLYMALVQYFVIPRYSIYDFMLEVPEEAIRNRSMKKIVEKTVNEVEALLEENNENNENKIMSTVDNIAKYFGFEISEDHVRKMILTIKDKKYHAAFHLDELEHVAITFHSAKGLEFDQVIVFANDYWLDKPDSIYNHYVAVTRAKSKLIIVGQDDVGTKKYLGNIRKLFDKSKVNLEDVITFAESGPQTAEEYKD